MLQLNNDIVTREEPSWQEMVAPYRHPDPRLSLWQVANTLIPLFLLWYLMYFSLTYSYWITLALTPLIAGCHIRAFIILHDCGHGAFFKRSWVNNLLGTICGVVCLTPYYHWRHSHALHHATSGDLDRRVAGQLLPVTLKRYTQLHGSMLTLTVKEYLQLSNWQKQLYRLYRNPFILFGLVPILLFVVLHRFSTPGAGRQERFSVYTTNLALLAVSLILIMTIGLIPFLLVEAPILMVTTTAAVWLFYVQHQFERTYWEQKPQWDYVSAALKGSSYYKLPRLLQWFTGNIGFHHIHHLSPRIPNYYLQKCHETNSLFQQTPAITLRSGMKSIFANLWDEEQDKMVRFSSLKTLRSN
jgi:omega-6 fatty acid desaturase (delta-12 desaturase)